MTTFFLIFVFSPYRLWLARWPITWSMITTRIAWISFTTTSPSQTPFFRSRVSAYILVPEPCEVRYDYRRSISLFLFLFSLTRVVLQGSIRSNRRSSSFICFLLLPILFINTHTYGKENTIIL